MRIPALPPTPEMSSPKVTSTLANTAVVGTAPSTEVGGDPRR